MRNFLFILFLFTTLSTYSSENISFFPLKQVGKVENIVFNDNGNFETNSIVAGKTYKFKESQLDFNISTNSSLKLYFSDETIFNLEEDVQLKMHTFSYDILNDGNLPKRLSSTNSNYILSLMNGTLDIVNDSNSSNFIIQTPRVSFTIKNGKYRIIVIDKTTVVAVLDGSVTFYKVVEGKEHEVTSGNLAHVTTYFGLTSKGSSILKNGNPTVNVKPIDFEDSNKMNYTFDELIELKNKVVFSLIGDTVVGIDLK